MANSTTHFLPYPIANARYSLPLSFRVSAGTPTDPTTPDTETSSDGGASFADCTEEITTGGSNGMGYLTLTGAETNFRMVLIAAKSANCLTTPAILHPRTLAIVGSGTLSAGSSGGGTLGTLLTYDVTGCFIRTTGGTGGGGTGGANNQARRILTYITSTGAFTVSTWETTPDATTTYDVLLPEGVTLGMLRTLNPATAGRTLVVDASGLADANMVKAGPTGSGTAQTAGDIYSKVSGLTFTVSNQVDVNVKDWAGAAVATPTNAGYPLIDIHSGTGTNQLSVSSGQVILQSGTGTGQLNFTSGVVQTDVAKIAGTAYASSELHTLASHDPGATLGTSTLTQTQVTGGAYALNSASFAFNAALDFSTTMKTSLNAATPAVTVSDKTGFSLANGSIASATFAAETGLKPIRSGTAQGGAATYITLDSGASASNNFYKHSLIYLTGGTGAGQVRQCYSYNGTNKNASVDQWTVNPDGTTTFAILPFDTDQLMLNMATDYDAGTLNTNISGSVNSVTLGVVLDATGLDAIPTTAPAGVAASFREMVVQLWRRAFKKSTLTTSQLKTYADDGTTVITTQAVTDDSTTQTMNGAT